MDGALITIDWNDLISRIDVNRSLSLALYCALQRSEYLYSEQFSLIFGDPDIRNLLLSKFNLLAQSPIDISQEVLESCISEKQDNPFSFPHSDSGIYNGNLFVGGQEGVHFSDTHAIEPRPDRLTDLPTLGIALGSGRLALAAGGEGVHQLDVFPSPTGVFRPVASKYANCVRWMQVALFASSMASEGAFVDFKTTPRKKSDDSGRPPERTIRGILSIDEIFGDQTSVDHVWGAEDRICVARAGRIDVVKFWPRRRLSERFERIGSLTDSMKGKGDFVSGDIAVFGFVTEFDRGVLVMDSSLQSTWLEGEPVNWRVFPRSRYYTNHLHVIQEDHLSVFSFNGDYFVDQGKKVSGIDVGPRSFSGGRRTTYVPRQKAGDPRPSLLGTGETWKLN